MSLLENPRSRWMDGRATFTMLKSRTTTKDADRMSSKGIRPSLGVPVHPADGPGRPRAPHFGIPNFAGFGP